MKKYIIELVNGTHYLISEEFRNEKLLKAMSVSEIKNLLLPDGDVIMINSIVCVSEYEKAKYKYSERLKLQNKRLCKLCGKVIQINEKCLCDDDLRSIDVENPWADIHTLRTVKDRLRPSQQEILEKGIKEDLKLLEKNG